MYIDRRSAFSYVFLSLSVILGHRVLIFDITLIHQQIDANSCPTLNWNETDELINEALSLWKYNLICCQAAGFRLNVGRRPINIRKSKTKTKLLTLAFHTQITQV